jgi:hypothetical protein
MPAAGIAGTRGAAGDRDGIAGPLGRSGGAIGGGGRAGAAVVAAGRAVRPDSDSAFEVAFSGPVEAFDAAGHATAGRIASVTARRQARAACIVHIVITPSSRFGKAEESILQHRFVASSDRRAYRVCPQSSTKKAARGHRVSYGGFLIAGWHAHAAVCVGMLCAAVNRDPALLAPGEYTGGQMLAGAPCATPAPRVFTGG